MLTLLATLTLGRHGASRRRHRGYGTDVDRDLIRAWWSLRCLTTFRWLVEHGFGPPRGIPKSPVCVPALRLHEPTARVFRRTPSGATGSRQRPCRSAGSVRRYPYDSH